MIDSLVLVLMWLIELVSRYFLVWYLHVPLTLYVNGNWRLFALDVIFKVCTVESYINKLFDEVRRKPLWYSVENEPSKNWYFSESIFCCKMVEAQTNISEYHLNGFRKINKFAFCLFKIWHQFIFEQLEYIFPSSYLPRSHIRFW